MEILLLLLIVVPLAGAIGVVATGARPAATRPAGAVRWTALSATLVTAALFVPVVVAYDAADERPAERPVLEWPAPPESVAASAADQSGTVNFRFALGVDGMSLWLVGLSALLMVTSVLVSWNAIREQVAGYYALLLVLEAGMIGVFLALDIILFYVFFEFTLIPLFFIIGVWGGYERRYAARKFFIYTLAGSVLTLLALLFLVLANSWWAQPGRITFSISELTENMSRLLASGTNPAAEAAGWWIFLGLFAGFAIKVPVWPLHTWLPLAHVEAPTAGSVLLAGILLKIGGYGFARFSLMLPGAAEAFVPLIAVLAVFGIVYGAFCALAQDDIKRLVAYSSVSHMGFAMLGLFALSAVGISGGVLVMVNHGLATGALFAMVGMLYERYHTRDIESFAGLARKMPVMAFFFIFFALASLGLPGLGGFVGEVLALLAMFRAEPVYAVFGAFGMIVGAWYLLRLVRRTMFGPLREPLVQPHEHEVRDLTAREIWSLAPLAMLLVWIGVWPQFFLDRMEPAVGRVAELYEESRETRVGRGVESRELSVESGTQSPRVATRGLSGLDRVRTAVVSPADASTSPSP